MRLRRRHERRSASRAPLDVTRRSIRRRAGEKIRATSSAGGERRCTGRSSSAASLSPPARAIRHRFRRTRAHRSPPRRRRPRRPPTDPATATRASPRDGHHDRVHRGDGEEDERPGQLGRGQRAAHCVAGRPIGEGGDRRARQQPRSESEHRRQSDHDRVPDLLEYELPPSARSRRSLKRVSRALRRIAEAARTAKATKRTMRLAADTLAPDCARCPTRRGDVVEWGRTCRDLRQRRRSRPRPPVGRIACRRRAQPVQATAHVSVLNSPSILAPRELVDTDSDEDKLGLGRGADECVDRAPAPPSPSRRHAGPSSATASSARRGRRVRTAPSHTSWGGGRPELEEPRGVVDGGQPHDLGPEPGRAEGHGTNRAPDPEGREPGGLRSRLAQPLVLSPTELTATSRRFDGQLADRVLHGLSSTTT